ncbi:hypothetical protein LWI29_027517 [Acer saccharum]|uniref:acetate--CoA ligase n=1 Tax=Acer saccharum TaxID=4024 RepID=A0AA39RVH4_ACESA|nr:hypothetical protein LWI29_027517 [Acer saccharum]
MSRKCGEPSNISNREAGLSANVRLENFHAGSSADFINNSTMRGISLDRKRHGGAGMTPQRTSAISSDTIRVSGKQISALASEENDLVCPSKDFSNQALIPSPQKYLEMYKRLIEDPSGFWSCIASEFYLKKKWDEPVCSENLDVSKGNIDNSILRVVSPIFLYLPMLMELLITMLACARIGAVHSVVFAGFSAETLAQRIMDCKPKAVITCNAVKRGPKVLNLKEIVDVGLTECAKNGISVDVCLTYENQLATNRESTKWQEGRDIWWQLKGLQNLVI